MDSTNEKKTSPQKLLRASLKVLSKEKLKDVSNPESYSFFEKIYSYEDDGRKFRHLYSELFSELTIINLDSDYSIDTLYHNIYLLYQAYPQYRKRNPNKVDIYPNLQKLYDHITLEYIRFSYFQRDIQAEFNEHEKSFKELKSLKQENEKLINEIKNLQKDVTDFKFIASEVDNLRDEATNIRKQNLILTESLKSAQKEYVAILGIFAAIVITFTGGMSVLGTAFESLNSTSIYKTLLVLLGTGMILMNLLLSLYYTIEKIVKPDPPVKTDTRRTANIVFIILFAILLIVWLFGLVEKRDTLYKDYLIIEETIKPNEKKKGE